MMLRYMISQLLINPRQVFSLDQIKDLLGSFSRTFEEKFAQMSSRVDSLSQDVTKSNAASFSTHSAVAGRAEPTPDKVPHCSYSDGHGSTLGRPAAAVASSNANPPTHILAYI